MKAKKKKAVIKKKTVRSKLVKEIKDKTKKPKTRKQKIKYLPSGSVIIDLICSDGKGYSTGIINLVGDSSSGKSFLSGECIAKTKQILGKNFNWFYDNCEMGYKINSKKLYDFDILKDGFLKETKVSDTIEDFEYNINYVIENKKPEDYFIYVLDSFDGFSSEDEEKYMEKRRKALKKKKEEEEGSGDESGTYGLAKQKFMHQFCRSYIRKLEKNNILLIIVSQIKGNIGVKFGSKYKRLGGKALDFYPSIVLWLAEVEKYLKKKRAVGICIKVKATKARSEHPFREGFIDLIFDYGIDDVATNLKFLYDLNTEKGKNKKKTICNWDGKEFTFESLVKHIEENDLELELENRVKELWFEIEESISSKGRKNKWKK